MVAAAPNDRGRSGRCVAPTLIRQRPCGASRRPAHWVRLALSPGPCQDLAMTSRTPSIPFRALRRQALGSVLLAACAGSQAATRTYVGLDDGAWHTAASWSPAGVPQGGDDVLLGSHAPAGGGMVERAEPAVVGLASLQRGGLRAQ